MEETEQESLQENEPKEETTWLEEMYKMSKEDLKELLPIMLF